MLNELKARLKRALGRFAKTKAQDQADGMALEAQGIVESTKSLARRNPAGLAAIVALGALVLWMMARQNRTRV